MPSRYGNDLVIVCEKTRLHLRSNKSTCEMQDIVLISIPESTIRNIVEQAVRKVISETPTAPAVPADGKPLLSRKEAAELAGVCITTIDNRVKEGVLKKCRVGGVVRFKREQVLEVFSQTVFQINPRRNSRATK